MARALARIYPNPAARVIPKSNPTRPSSSPPRPMMLTMSNTSPYLASINSDIEAHLKRAISVKLPLSVYEPMHHLTFSAPPTMGPALCVTVCELFCGGYHDRAASVAAASALRLVHAASYAHNQLLEAGGGPKHIIDSSCSPNIKLLIGDGLLPFGMELLAQSEDSAQNNSDRVLRAMVELTNMIGSQGTIDGKYYEIVETSPSDDGEFSSSHVELIQRVAGKIEGRFHACAAACGAILGGANEGQIGKLRNYGFYMGKIQGVLNWVSGKERGLISKQMENMRELAIKELKDFEGKEVEAMLSFVDVNLMS